MILSFLFTILLMEYLSYIIHKYVMHGPLWKIHEDHHRPVRGRKWQKNDLFSLFFALLSFVFILLGNIYALDVFLGAGYGVMAYGLIYFLVHEIVIHGRYRFMNLHTYSNSYLKVLKKAHRDHHAILTQEDGVEFGMLFTKRLFKKKKPSHF